MGGRSLRIPAMMHWMDGCVAGALSVELRVASWLRAEMRVFLSPKPSAAQRYMVLTTLLASAHFVSLSSFVACLLNKPITIRVRVKIVSKTLSYRSTPLPVILF
jgi:hypothetical protein